MIYYKVSLYGESFQVKKLSPNLSFYRVIHKHGILEIFKNRSSGKWSILYRSNPDDLITASFIGPEIEKSYQTSLQYKLARGFSPLIRVFS